MSEPIRAVFTNDKFAKAFQFAKTLCQEPRHGIRKLVILVPVKANISPSTTLGAYLGEPTCKALEKSQSISFAGIPMQLETNKTLRSLSADTLIICAYASQDIMDKVDSVGPVAGVIALPYADDVVEPWIKSWSPLINGAPQAHAKKLIEDPVVERAMEGLSRWINLAHAVLNVRDKDHANQTLRILRRKKHTFDPQALRAWAVSNAWKPSAADELYTLATKILSLKGTPKIDRLDAAEHSYNCWVKDAKKR